MTLRNNFVIIKNKKESKKMRLIEKIKSKFKKKPQNELEEQMKQTLEQIVPTLKKEDVFNEEYAQKISEGLKLNEEKTMTSEEINKAVEFSNMNQELTEQQEEYSNGRSR